MPFAICTTTFLLHTFLTHADRFISEPDWAADPGRFIADRVQFWRWLHGQTHRRTSPAQQWTGQDRRHFLPAQKWTGQARIRTSLIMEHGEHTQRHVTHYGTELDRQARFTHHHHLNSFSQAVVCGTVFSTIPAGLPGPGALTLGYSFALFIFAEAVQYNLARNVRLKNLEITCFGNEKNWNQGILQSDSGSVLTIFLFLRIVFSLLSSPQRLKFDLRRCMCSKMILQSLKILCWLTVTRRQRTRPLSVCLTRDLLRSNQSEPAVTGKRCVCLVFSGPSWRAEQRLAIAKWWKRVA